MEKIKKEDLIRRSDVIDALRTCQTYLFDTHDKDKKISLEDAEYWIEQLPSVEPKHGKWYIENNSFVVLDVCDQCMKSVRHVAPFYDFCPHCGADMR